MAAYRDRKHDGTPASVPAVPAAPGGDGMARMTLPGPQETLIAAEIASLGLTTLEADTQANLALMAARALDDVERSEKWHLLPAAARSLTGIMARLRELEAPLPPPPSEGEHEGGLDEFGMDDFCRSLSIPSNPPPPQLTYYFYGEDEELVQTFDKDEADARNTKRSTKKQHTELN